MTTATKERPLTLNAEQVRAVLNGSKTVHVVPVMPQPLILDSGGAWYPEGRHPKARHYANGEHLRKGLAADFAPYQPGDRLWVREAWCEHTDNGSVFYKADDWPTELSMKWRSPMHMPRWASRLTLEVEAVKVIRVQEISEQEALSEGCQWSDGMNMWAGEGEIAGHWCLSHDQAFGSRWDAANRKHPWKSNPWVWVVTFRKEAR